MLKFGDLNLQNIQTTLKELFDIRRESFYIRKLSETRQPKKLAAVRNFSRPCSNGQVNKPTYLTKKKAVYFFTMTEK